MLESALRVPFRSAKGDLAFHCREIAFQKSNRVTDEGKLNHFHLVVGGAAEEGLGVRWPIHVDVNPHYIFVADGVVRIDLERLKAFRGAGFIMAGARRSETRQETARKKFIGIFLRPSFESLAA